MREMPEETVRSPKAATPTTADQITTRRRNSRRVSPGLGSRGVASASAGAGVSRAKSQGMVMPYTPDATKAAKV